ncbi:hypothetical protein BX070DRAFT_250709 [Coemansia spiralis]|nr:hypothetical protein BX070DRAFT_250709 [Coemansia spiralis]
MGDSTQHLTRSQHLQTVAVETALQLRSQTIHLLQTQAIRLEDFGDTELEDQSDTSECSSELQQMVLLTELRRELREISSSLEDLQFRLCLGRKTRREVLPQVSEADTFRTARGGPFPASGNEAGDEPGEELNGEQASNQTHEQAEEDPAQVLEALERRLHSICGEVIEWRRTQCIIEFISETDKKNADRPAHKLPSRALERQHKRRSGFNNTKTPPLSRLVEVERTLNRPTTNTLPATSIEPQQTLHLLEEEPTEEPRSRTHVNDVRIIGWATRGRGLDVHTEFKVVVHLSRGANMTVMRRYTEFELLRDAVCAKYPMFQERVPALPPKRAFGKFDDRFLTRRESGLQFFLAYVMLHPVIGCSGIIKQWLEGGS